MDETDRVASLVEQKERDKLAKAWARFICCTVHDITSPLALIRMSSQNVEEYFPHLLTGYRLAVAKGLLEPEISEDRLKTLEEVLVPNIPVSAGYLFDFLKQVRPFAEKLLSSSPDMTRLTFSQCLEDALKKYPFEEASERQLIHSDCHYDFTFQGDPLYIESLINSLLFQALYNIRNRKKGEVTLRTEETPQFSLIYFRDTSQGIDKGTLSQVFDDFFCGACAEDRVVRPALGLCRLALLQSGGDILCETATPEYTEFVIKIPKS